MSHTKADRKWVRGAIIMSGQRVGAHTIRCSECPNSKDVLDRGYRQLPFDEVQRRFQRAKWFVGHNEKHDLCPDCIKRHSDERRAKRKPQTPVLTIVSTTPPTTTKEKPMTTTMPDRAMTRDDKRVINLKLHEVYIGETHGYAPPHTDHSLAKELGVPVGWVRDIREELFGPAHSNSDIDATLSKIEAAKKDATAILTKAEATMAAFGTMSAQITAIREQIAEVKRTIESLSRSAETIKKAVGA